MEEEFQITLTHEEAIELAGLLGSLCTNQTLYDMYSRLTGMFPGGIDYPPYLERYESYGDKK